MSLLEVRDLAVTFPTETERVAAVRGLNYHVDKGEVVALVKPQFEAGRSEVGRDGVVRDPDVRRRAIEGIAAFCREMGSEVIQTVPSCLPGPKGNVEEFIWFKTPQGCRS